MLKLRLPSALPFVFNALKLNATLALIGAIVAEFFGTPIVGMGFRISTEAARLDLGSRLGGDRRRRACGHASASRCCRCLNVPLRSGIHPTTDKILPLARKEPNTMRRVFLAATLLIGMSGLARAADPLTLQLKWVTQAQFAGYYVAQAKGLLQGKPGWT